MALRSAVVLVLALLLVPGFVLAAGGLVRNGDFAQGTVGWGTWSPTPERLRFEAQGGRALLGSRGGEPVTGCFAQDAGELDPSHRYVAAASIDASRLAAGQAVLRVEFWAAGGSGPASRADSEPVSAGKQGDRTVNFTLPAGTARVKVVGYVVDARGTAAFADLALHDRTGPLLRVPPSLARTEGMALTLEAELLDGGVQALRTRAIVAIVRDGKEVSRQFLPVDVAAGEKTILRHDAGALPAGIYQVRWTVGQAERSQTIRVLGTPKAGPERNRFGGWHGRNGEKTGFFHAEKMGQRWWLVDPEGWGFLSVGVNAVRQQGTGSPALGYSPYQRSVKLLYGDDAEWAATTVRRLRTWGFNTVGSWSTPVAESVGMPYCHILDIGRQATRRQLTRPPKGRSPWSWFPDVFGPEFEAGARRVAREACAPRRDDPYLVGYFLDNEFRWEGLWEAAFASAPDSPCRDAFVACARRTHPDAAVLRTACAAAGVAVTSADDLRRIAQAPAKGLDALRDAWLEAVAERYFSVTAAAVREADPNHMVISQRFAGHAPDWAARAAGRHCDVFCINFYNSGVAYGVSESFKTRLVELGELTGRPILIGEWSFKAMDSGLPNAKGAATPVETQEDRAVGYASFMTAAMGNPYIVGAHWFLHSDQPYEGRSDGENSNYGLVDLADRPYGTLVSTTAFVNRFSYPLAAATTFAKSPVEILPVGRAWVRVKEGPLSVNADPQQSARFSARQTLPGVGDRWLSIGGGPGSKIPPGGVRFAWTGAESLVGGACWPNGLRGYEIREPGPDGAVLAQDRCPLADPGIAHPRAFMEAVPDAAILPGATVPLRLAVWNPTNAPLTGALRIEPSAGWTLGSLPEVAVPAGGCQEIRTTLAAPADAIPYPRLVVLEPFVDVVVLRVGQSLDMAACSLDDGVGIRLRNRAPFAGQGVLEVASEPPGVSGRFAFDGQAGQAGPCRLPWTCPGGVHSVLVRGTCRRGQLPPVPLEARLYHFQAADWQCDPPVARTPDRGPDGMPCLRIARETPGTTEWVLPTVPVPPAGQSVLVRLDTKWERVVRGRGQSWHRANVALSFEDSDGNYVAHSDILLGHDDSDWHPVAKLLRVPKGALRMHVKARLLECTGTLWVADPRIMAAPANLARELAGE